jgi:hypothetical protein
MVAGLLIGADGGGDHEPGKTSHWVTRDQVEEVNRLLIEFLRELL